MTRQQRLRQARREHLSFMLKVAVINLAVGCMIAGAVFLLAYTGVAT